VLSVVVHILLLGELATLMVPTATPQRFPVTLAMNGDSAQVPAISIAAPSPLVNNARTTKEQPTESDASIDTLRQFHADSVAQADRLEQKFVDLARVIAAKEHTIQQQQRQTDAVQQETARLTEALAARTAAEQELAVRLAEEQRRRAQLEAEVAEQQRRYQASLRGSQETYQRLLSDLQGEIARKDITIREFADQLTINIVDRILFPSGQATLTVEGKKVLETIGQTLAKVIDRRIQIEGHTDAQEIGPGLKQRFASNWELSTARATEVVRYLLARSSIPPERLLAVGRADTAPVASNATEAGRQLNRRIEIILLPLAKPLQADHGANAHSG
jgi:chemotaxis protein MotB